MRQEMRWERHFVPFTGKLSLLILLGLFIGLVGGWQIVDGMIDYNRSAVSRTSVPCMPLFRRPILRLPRLQG